jgi:hypothetical protein
MHRVRSPAAETMGAVPVGVVVVVEVVASAIHIQTTGNVNKSKQASPLSGGL